MREGNKLKADQMEDDQFDTIQEILNCDRYTAGEKGYVKFQLGISDGFYANFWETIARADDENFVWGTV